MKHTNMKLAHLVAALVLTFCSFGVYAVESQEAAPINKDQVNGRVEEAQGGSVANIHKEQSRTYPRAQLSR